MRKVKRAMAATLMLCLMSASTHAGTWSDPATVSRRGMEAVSYRARVDGSWLVVEARHGEGWHTYSMDNVLRAREATGREKPDCELPTVISVEGGLAIAGNWRQSEPKDMTIKKINWYTWGFEGTAYFAVPVEKVGDAETRLTINAQACDAGSCQMVQDVVLELDASDAADDSAPDIEGLIEVRSAADAQ